MNTSGQRFLCVLASTCILLAMNPAPSLASASGERAGEFMRIPAEPIGRSLAGAHLAEVNGPECLAWNPAGLGRDEGAAAILSHATWMAETSWEWGAVAIPLAPSAGTIGFSCGVLRSGDLERYDADGSREGSFSPLQAVGSLAYGRAFGSQFEAGVTCEAALERDGIDKERLMVAGGGGMQLHLGRISVGAAALHLGPPVKIDGETYPLPATLRAGATMHAGAQMAFHAATEWTVLGSPCFMAGWQWEPVRGICALAGAIHDPSYSDQALRPTYGLRLDAGPVGFAYGYQPSAWLEASHQLALTLRLSD